MSLVVGVHGIAQQQFGRKQLMHDWCPAFVDGITLAFDHPVADPPFDLAFYGNVFLDRSRSAATKGVQLSESDDVLASLSEAETSELLDVAAEAVTSGGNRGRNRTATVEGPVAGSGERAHTAGSPR